MIIKERELFYPNCKVKLNFFHFDAFKLYLKRNYKKIKLKAFPTSNK